MSSSWKKLLEFALPAKWRGRSLPNEGQNDATMARLPDADPVLRALLDLAYGQFEQETTGALVTGLTSEERAYRCGRAASLGNFLLSVSNWRDSAREAAAKKQPRR